MNISNLLRKESKSVLSDEQEKQASALLKSGGNPNELIARAALAQSWNENSLERAKILAHDRGIQAGTIIELFPSQTESKYNAVLSEIDTFVPGMRHVKIILPHMVDVELFDQDSDIV